MPLWLLASRLGGLRRCLASSSSEDTEVRICASLPFGKWKSEFAPCRAPWTWRRPERIQGSPALHDPGYEPLWAYLEEADRPFALHPGLNGIVPCEELRHRYDDNYAAMHAVHFPMEQMLGMTDLICFGVLDRHPGLRVAFLETGAAWALSYLHRLDEHLELFGFPDRPKEKPSDQFRRQCFVSVEEVEPGLSEMLESYPDSVMFASDYPHGDGVFPGSTRELLETDCLDEAQRARVLFRNAQRFYRI